MKTQQSNRYLLPVSSIPKFALVLLLFFVSACQVNRLAKQVESQDDINAAMMTLNENQAWRLAKKLETLEGYASYLHHYPEGKYSADAQVELEALVINPRFMPSDPGEYTYEEVPGVEDREYEPPQEYTTTTSRSNTSMSSAGFEPPPMPTGIDRNANMGSTAGTAIPESYSANQGTSNISMETLEQAGARSASSIQNGYFKYDPIPDLYVNEPFTFKLEILPGSEEKQLTVSSGGGSGTANTVVKKIPVTSEMSVRIIADEEAMKIESLSGERQAIMDGMGTEWVWDITPLKVGPQRVRVMIDIFTKSQLSDETVKSSKTIYDDEVEVVVNESRTEAFVDDADKEKKDSFSVPYWIIPILVVGALIVWFLLKKSKEKKMQHAPAAALGLMDSAAAAPITARYRVSLPPEKAMTVLQVVESLLTEGELGTALDKMVEFFEKEVDPLRSELLSLSSEYSEFEKERDMGLSPDPAVRNRIRLAVSNLLVDLREALAKA